MRITNNMINDNAALNINGNKIMVDADNNRMTTQKKIDRPSEDPIIAVRSLRLQTSLMKVNQYYEKNIPDAQSWMDITETALLNIRDIMTDVRTLCVKGSTDTLTEDDRKTIYDQLKSLQEQCFAEGNADYAGRTVFTGFRTDKNLTFMKEEKNTSYNIEEPLKADTMTKSRFYTNEVTVPTNPTDVQKLMITGETDATLTDPDTMEIQESDFYKLRLSYDLTDTKNSAVNSFQYSYEYNGQLVKANINWGDTSKLTTADTNWEKANQTATDKKLDVGGVEHTYQVVEIDPSTAYEKVYKSDGKGNIVYENGEPVEVTDDRDGRSDASKNPIKYVYQFDDEADWAAWSKLQQAEPDGGNSDRKTVPDDAVVIIKETGDVIFGESVATPLMTYHSDMEFDYTKKGFKQGELKPEYYFNSRMTVDVNDNATDVLYDKIGADGSMLNYSIDYTIAQNQELGVNLEANECFNHDIYQDMNDMIEAISQSQQAHDKYDKIKAMMEEDQYASAPYPDKLKGWLELAEKEMNYYDDNLSKLYSTTLGKVDTYISKITLSITDLGCRVDQLKLTQKRMSEQQETIEDLKSENDNLDLSQIIMDYTSSYTAYQSSLVAAGKLGEQTLLNYI